MRGRLRTTLLVAILGAVIGWVFSDLYSARIDLFGLTVESDEPSEEFGSTFPVTPESAADQTAETTTTNAADVIAVE
ncbi:MAG: hypothetical protein ACR2QQ_06450, partial [Gammaproteobacteria bacterium]